jgi:hypothetical protein
MVATRLYNLGVIAGVWKEYAGWASPVPAVVSAICLGLLLGALAALGSPMLAAAALLGVAGGLALLREPGLGLYALVGLIYLLPFAVIPARIGVQLTVLEAILGLTLGVVLLRALQQRRFERPGSLVALLVGVLLLAGLAFLLSLPFTGSSSEVSRRFFKLLLAMLAFPLTIVLVQERARLEWLVRSLMLLGGLQAALAVALHLMPRAVMVRLLSTLGPLGYPTGDAILRFLPGENDTYTDVLRATGTVIDPNVLGGEMMLAAALLLSQLFAPRPLLPRLLLLPAGGLAVLAMLVSQSRSSWVGLAAGLLLLATLRYRKVWLAIVPAALAIMLLPTGRALYARVLSGFAGQDKAAGMRIDEYRNALEIIAEYPLLGIGFGTAPAIDLAPGVSSMYLTVAETMGLPALVLLMTLLGLLLVRALRVVLGRCEWRLQGVAAGLLTALVAALVAGLFDHYFTSAVFPHMVALFWLHCGLLERTYTLAAAKQPLPERSGAYPMMQT